MDAVNDEPSPENTPSGSDAHVQEERMHADLDGLGNDGGKIEVGRVSEGNLFMFFSSVCGCVCLPVGVFVSGSVCMSV